ncbi:MULTISPECIES: hypothetical protein [Aureimonas]|uniref:Uncharacterized protein n=1 Tax=Aureimonas ureilytica TaxID=401562 RepID=A0A175QZX0_9HYPH|nr:MULTISPECIES: hypothetical protein [Aureimonas]KTQ82349.1 hypothetical protein NS226_22420 [Aureimonas ureilytica]
MKKSLIVAIAGLLVATAVPASAQSYHSDARQYRQQERIERGYRHGRISPREAARLERQQRRIERVERRARYYNNGRIDPRSAHKIKRMQDRANHAIRRANRDGYYR